LGLEWVIVLLKTRGKSRILKLGLEGGKEDRSTSRGQLRIPIQGIIREKLQG